MASLAASLGIARKVGEGYDRPNADNEVPIDVNYARLAEWLVDRKQLPADWTRKLQALQAKAAEALKELPPGFLGHFEGGEEVPLDYLRAREVLGVLGESAEKSFLGSFKGAAGAWEKIVRAYEYNLLHLAEGALALGRNVDYEIPFLKRQAAKYQQQLGDLERRGAEALRSAAAAAAEFEQECRQLGVDGRDIRGGLVRLTLQLPGLVGEAVDALQAEAVGQAAEHYLAFAAQCAGGGSAQEGAVEVLPTLKEVREGRTEPPPPSSSSSSGGGGGAAANSEAGAPAGIDWGIATSGDGSAAAAAGEPAGGISWGMGVSASEGAGAGGISWDLGDLGAALEGLGEGGDAGEEGQAEGKSGGAAALDISWDIDLTTAGEEAQEQLAEQQGRAAGDGAAAAAELAGGSAGTPEFGDEPPAVQRIIEDHAYRAQLLNDLLELRAFLSQRLGELSSKGNELLALSVPEEAQHVGADAVATMRDAVAAAIAALTGERLQQLLLLRSSPHHLDRLTQSLAHKGGQEAKFKRAAREAEAKRGEAQRQLMADSAKLAVLVKRTRAIKGLVESQLGAKLGRRINIMGEINNLI